MVVQLAFDDGAAIVDPLAVPDLRPLLEALAETTVVGHALSSDLKIFADRFDEVPTAVFDTQVAAAFLGFGMQISLADLVRELEGVRLAKSQTVSDWSTRPFTSRQLEYLVDDVAHLLPMHDKLQQRLRDAGRLEWALEECAALGEIDRYRSDERRAYLAHSGRDAHEPPRTRRACGDGAVCATRMPATRDLPPKVHHARRRRLRPCDAAAQTRRRSRPASPPRCRRAPVARAGDRRCRRAGRGAAGERAARTAGAPARAKAAIRLPP